VATSADANSYPRRMLAAEMAAKEMAAKVTAAVARVVGRVATPEPAAAPRPPPPCGADAALFAAGNGGCRPRLYFSEEVFSSLGAVRTAALETAGGLAAAAAAEAPKAPEGEEEVATAAPAWDGSLAAVAAAVDALAAAVAALDPVPEPLSTEEGAEPVVAAPTPAEVLAQCRADLAAAAAAALLPGRRNGIYANAMSEALAAGADTFEAVAAAALAEHGPPAPPPPPPAEGEGQGDEGAAAGGGDESAPAEGEAAPAEGDDGAWREAYMAALTAEVGAMLGGAVDAFGALVVEADAEVNAECERRAAVLSAAVAAAGAGAAAGEGAAAGAGGADDEGEAEWKFYAMQRRRKALLGCEP